MKDRFNLEHEINTLYLFSEQLGSLSEGILEHDLSKDEIALSQKMLGRDILKFYCIGCLAESLDCNPDDLVVKIQEFKEQGCTLFL